MTAPNRQERSTVVLRSHAVGALSETAGPLGDPDVRRIVVAAAEGIAERTGVRLLSIEPAADAVTLTVEGPTLVAVGFAAELRRATEQWHRAKYGQPLWSDDT
jgi:hypothetical protein